MIFYSLLHRLCQSAFDDVLLHFNVTKCAALRVGARYKSPCASLEALDGSIIPWVIEFRYLGVVLHYSIVCASLRLMMFCCTLM